MSKTDFLESQIKRVIESLTDRGNRIAAEAAATESADNATLAAVERMLAEKRDAEAKGIAWIPIQEREHDVDENHDDFAAETGEPDRLQWKMPWRSHLAELIRLLNEDGYEVYGARLKRLADVNSLKLPFTPADEAAVIRSLLGNLAAFHAAEGEAEPPKAARHSPDYRSVWWYGTQYTLTATQAACVKFLWEAWKQGTPDVGEATILEGADSECGRLSDLFGRGSNRNPAWGTMIQSGATKGTYRLAEPEI